MISLPVDQYVGPIVAAVRRSRAVVVTAAPGAGKTTRIPPALIEDGAVILLQPRRVAARSIASRIAVERGWTLGQEVGWQVRFDRNFSERTRLLVVTEGILTARLQSDPLLSGFRTIVLDEFHERSIHADVALALAREAWRARASAGRPAHELRIVVMSATLDAGAVSSYLDGCPAVDVPGRVHALQVTYRADQTVAAAAAELAAATSGHLLCFLPGAVEIQRTVADVRRRFGDEVDVLPLHGSLAAEEQDRAIRPAARRRIIVATNIAETSLTVPGVTGVIDSGLQKVARYDAERGIDSLEVERVTADAADQRAGRAGRESAGVVRRLWDERDRLRPHREPDIARVDLAGPALDVIAWGGDPRALEWFERPPSDALDRALALLERLELVRGRRLTALGEQVRRFPLHPRLGRMLAAADGARDIARVCAILSERHMLPSHAATTTSDLLSALDRWDQAPPHVERAADFIQSTIRSQSVIAKPQSTMLEPSFRRAILAGYPDRVAQRREPGSSNFLLATGTGATLGRESGVRDAEFIVALDISSAGASGPRSERGQERAAAQPLIRLASRVEREWLTPTASAIEHRFDSASGRVRAARVDRYDALVIGEHPVPVDPDAAAALLADAWRERGPDEDDRHLERRIAFAGLAVDMDELVRTAARSASSLDEVRFARALSPHVTHELERDAPSSIVVPSGRAHRIEYHEDGSASASIKLQELFGLAETPRIGRRRVPLRIALLAPNGRPVQVTQDLRSFWERTYPEVRRELRGRYPKHPWPEDPWTASPSARTARKSEVKSKK